MMMKKFTVNCILLGRFLLADLLSVSAFPSVSRRSLTVNNHVHVTLKGCDTPVRQLGSGQTKIIPARKVSCRLHISDIETLSPMVERFDGNSPEMAEVATNAVGGLSSETVNVLVFIVGLIPFLVATNEFWRRIAVGEPFGTGSDSVVIIGEDDNPKSSRGRQTLGKGALTVAYILFAVAALSVGVALFSVVSSPSFDSATLKN